MRCPNCRLENPPSAEKCDCGYSFLTNRKEAPIPTGRHQDRTPDQAADDMLAVSRIFGIALIVVGLAVAIGFMLVFDTTVASGETEERVNNIGLLQNQQTGILGGLLLSILGGTVLLYGKE